MSQPYELTACEALAALRTGDLRPSELVGSCIDQIASLEPTLEAWTYFDEEGARDQAAALDNMPADGPLYGLPIGIKDVIDVAGMPATYGSPIYKQHYPAADAACVTIAREAGAVIMGKTVTTEFACGSTVRTSNPLNIEHTSGGSSAGSCAAVASKMIPVAFGSQSASSTIRPASYCGLVGMRPSMGVISVAGFKYFNRSFDTIGLIARDVDDVELLWTSQLGLPFSPATPLDRKLRVALCHPDWMSECEPYVRGALDAAAATLAAAGAEIQELTLPAEYADLPQLHVDMQAFETARSYAHEYATNRDQIDWRVRSTIEHGLSINAEHYIDMMQRATRLRAMFAGVIGDADLILTNAAPGEAPKNWRVLGDDFSMGDPVQSRPWTLLHLPAITVPSATGPFGLPLGVQLISTYGTDLALLRAARWIEAVLRPTHSAAA